MLSLDLRLTCLSIRTFCEKHRLPNSLAWYVMVGVAGTSNSTGSRFTLKRREMRGRTRRPKRQLFILTFPIVPCHRGTTYRKLVTRFGCWDRPVGRLCPRNKNESYSRKNKTLLLLPVSMPVGDDCLWIGHCRLTHGYLLADEPQSYWEDWLLLLTLVHFLVKCSSLGDLHRRFLPTHRSADGFYSLVSILGEESSQWECGLFLFLNSACCSPGYHL